MATLPPPATKQFPDDSIEKKVYKVVENLIEYLPVTNDRNRLGFSLYKYVMGEGDEPSVLVKSTKVRVIGISLPELAKKLTIEIDKIRNELS